MREWKLFYICVKLDLLPTKLKFIVLWIIICTEKWSLLSKIFSRSCILFTLLVSCCYAPEPNSSVLLPGTKLSVTQTTCAIPGRAIPPSQINKISSSLLPSLLLNVVCVLLLCSERDDIIESQNLLGSIIAKHDRCQYFSVLEKGLHHLVDEVSVSDLELECTYVSN